jgi:adenylate kinase family enzyme
MHDVPNAVGTRVLVIGMAGSGKSTFSRALSAETGLPVVHLDVHYWKPGWARPSDEEWRDTQRGLLAGDAWIADGNYYDDLDLQLERTDTVIVLDTPWWICARRAFVRGIRSPGGEMPAGCEDSVARRLRDEWAIVGRVWLRRRTDPERARMMVSEHGSHAAVHVLGSKQDAARLLAALRDR